MERDDIGDEAIRVSAEVRLLGDLADHISDLLDNVNPEGEPEEVSRQLNRTLQQIFKWIRTRHDNAVQREAQLLRHMGQKEQ